MTIEELIRFITNINIWSVVKVFVLFGLIIYLGFSFIIVRVVALMNRTLIGVFNLPITIISWLHLLFALFVFMLALIAL